MEGREEKKIMQEKVFQQLSYSAAAAPHLTFISCGCVVVDNRDREPSWGYISAQKILDP
jgi:hypothetical protein